MAVPAPMNGSLAPMPSSCPTCDAAVETVEWDQVFFVKGGGQRVSGPAILQPCGHPLEESAHA